MNKVHDETKTYCIESNYSISKGARISSQKFEVLENESVKVANRQSDESGLLVDDGDQRVVDGVGERLDGVEDGRAVRQSDESVGLTIRNWMRMRS